MRLLLLLAALALTGCASLEIAPPTPLSAETPNVDLRQVLDSMGKQQAGYIDMYERLNREAGIYDGVSTFSSVATLGFGAFGAHKDNVLAAALITGVTGIARDQLNPRAAALYYAKGADALKCIADRARLVRYTPVRSSPFPTDEQLENNAFASETDLSSLEMAIHQTLGRASGLTETSDLVAAVTAAEEAEKKLTAAVKIQADISFVASDARDKVTESVRNKQPPSVQAMLEQIIAYKPPKATPAASSSQIAAKAMARVVTGKILKDDAFLAAMDAEAIETAKVIKVLNQLTKRTEQLDPENQVNVVQQINVCVIAYSTEVPKK